MSDTSIASGNVVSMALQHARENPDRIAVVVPKAWDGEKVTEERVLTYKDLADKMQSFRAGLAAQGFKPGDRIILLFPISEDFFALVMAILASGMTTVLIDTGMGTERIKSAMDTANATGIITMAALLKYRFILKQLRRIPKKFAVDKAGWFVKHFDKLMIDGDDVGDALTRQPDDEALITFTSGSTGAPKGANRTHGFLLAQYNALCKSLPPFEGQVEIQSFPVVALHNLCCGATTVMPAVDLATPAAVDPKVLLHQINTWKVNSIGAAPAFMNRFGEYATENNIVLPNMQRCFTGGAPVSADLCRDLLKTFPNVTGYSVYGSTEAEPMAKARFEEVVETYGKGEGFLGGRVAEVATIAVARFTQEPPVLGEKGIAPFSQAQGELGEIVVKGDHVNQGYIDNPKADLENKIKEVDGTIWHRTGDVGYFDENGLLWLTGRVNDVVTHYDRILQPLPIEAELDALESVVRSALVSSQSAPNGYIFVEIGEGYSEEKVSQIIDEKIAARGLQKMDIGFLPKMAVDGRHNSKIDRPTLRELLDKR